MKLFVGAAVAACLMIASQPANAQNYQRASVSVGHGDLNLNSAAGSAVMYARIEAAAQQICGDPSAERNWRVRREMRACIETATRDAVASAGSASLTAYAAAPGYFQRRVEFNRDTREARIYYADLNLDSERGQATLQRRLNRAADQLCRSAGDRRARTACEGGAREQAQTQVAAITSGRQLAQAGEGQVVMAATSVSAGAGDPPLPAPAAQPQPIAATTSDYGVCATRSHNAAFSPSSAALGTAARREIGYAVDSASVCSLDRAVIAADSSSALAQRRAAALRSALIARGVPASRIVIEDTQAADGGAVAMQFNGVARGDTTTHAEAREAGV